MSLTLRKNTQELLNNVGLDDYHTRIDENKYMSIVGPCGKPLITITGIEFTRREPTKAEIEFAVKLFDEFLTDHSAEITKFVKMLKVFSQKTEPPVKSKNVFLDNITYGREIYARYQDGIFTLSVSISKAGAFIIKGTTKNEYYPESDWFNFKLNKALYYEACVLLKDYDDWKKEEKAVDKARSALNTCDI